MELLALASWVDVLGGIPKKALEQAFGEWERCEERRPTPAGIRKRALARIEPPEKRPDQIPEPTPQDEIERRQSEKFQAEIRRIYPKLRSMNDA